MSGVVLEDEIRIPGWVRGLRSFRRWACSEEFPERGRFSFIDGEVWVDMSPEELLSHNQVKGEVAAVVGTIVKQARLGRFFFDRALLTHPAADLSTEPDGMFVSTASLRSGRVRFVESDAGYLELEGSPDMVLEVVNKSSVKKDTITLRQAYWRADVREYWLVDARGGQVHFDILGHTRRGYVARPKRSGWIRSGVFDTAFSWSAEIDELGYPQYTLLTR